MRYLRRMKVQKKSRQQAAHRPRETRQPPKPELVVLLAHGFDAQLVTEITTHGRSAAQPVTLISLTSGPQRSELGISLNPDQNLEQFSVQRAPVVIFPGGKNAAMALLRDPRVHRLCEAVWTQGGQVVAAASIRTLLQEAGIRVADLEVRTPHDWWREYLSPAI